MNVKVTIPIIVFGLLLNINLYGQQVFEFNELVISGESQYQKQQVQDTLYYQLNPSIFTGDKLKAGNRLKIYTATNELELSVRRVSEYIEGYTSVSAVSEDGKSIFTFTEKDNRVIGLLHEFDTNLDTHFKFDPTVELNYQTTSAHDALSCGLEEATVEELDIRRKVKSNDWWRNKLGPTSEMEEKNTTIDIMIAYTNDARSWAETTFEVTDIFDSITQAMNLSQSALDNSGVPITLRLVSTFNLDYDQRSDSNSAYLLRLMPCSVTGTDCSFYENQEQDEDDLIDFEPIHDERDAVGADLIALFAVFEGTGGVAYVLNNVAGSPYRGYSVNRVQQMQNTYTLIHEIGHNLGLKHARNQENQPSESYGGIFHESVGYLQPIFSKATIMAYQGGHDRIPYFSSPNLRYLGFPIGTNNPLLKADAVSSLKKTKDIVANYFTTKIDAPKLSISTDVIGGVYNGSAISNSSFTLTNTGSSDLRYFINAETFGITRLNNGSYLKKRLNNEIQGSNTVDTIYTSSFSTDGGFAIGNHSANNGWRAYNFPAVIEFGVESTQDSSQLVIENLESGWNIYSPYIEQLPYGNYELTIRLKMETLVHFSFDVQVIDESYVWVGTGSRIWEVIWPDNKEFRLIRPRVEVPENNIRDYIQDGWNELKINYNADDKTRYFLLNNHIVGRAPYTTSYDLPRAVILSGSDLDVNDSDKIKIDYLSLTRIAGPTNWISIDKRSGVIEPNQSEAIGMSINIPEGEADLYELNLVIYTNDTNEPIRVPVVFTNSNADTDIINSLSQNYPNPFRNQTIIEFRVNSPGVFKLEIFDIKGAKVQEIFDRNFRVGDYQLEFNSGLLASGVYIYRLTKPDGVVSKKMTIIR